MFTTGDPSAVGIMEGAYFVSKRELVEWLRQDFGFNNVDVKECGNGLVYLKILDRLYPGRVPLRKVKPNARQEWECLHNLKLLQAVFQDCSIRKHVEIEKLSKCNYQDNLEFLQWLKCFYDKFAGDSTLKDSFRPSCNSATASIARLTRNCSNSSASRQARPAAAAAPSPSGNPTAASEASSGNPTCGRQTPQQLTGGIPRSFSKKEDELPKLKEELEAYKRELREVQTDLDCSVKEGQFFFGKLRKLEVMSNEEGRTSFTVQEVQDILFAEDDLMEEQSPADGELAATEGATKNE